MRKIELTCEGGMLLSEEKQTVFVEASILPEEAAANVQEDEIIWRVVNDAGLKVQLQRCGRSREERDRKWENFMQR